MKPPGDRTDAPLTPGESAEQVVLPTSTHAVPSWLLALLRVPLIGKLIGANVLIAGAVCGAATLMHQDWTSETTVLVVSLLSLLGVVLVNIGLVMLALRPLADLESTAKRIWRGAAVRQAGCGPPTSSWRRT